MSNLKKEFKKRDVERMRNLITGKNGKKTTLGIGYTKKQKHHEEGDVWEEDGRTWTIKEGVKQNITKQINELLKNKIESISNPTKTTFNLSANDMNHTIRLIDEINNEMEQVIDDKGDLPSKIPRIKELTELLQKLKKLQKS